MKLFPYLTENQVRNALEKLREFELIETGNYNELPYDKTLWYTLSDKGMKLFYSRIDWGKITNPLGEISPTNTIYKTIPVINSSCSEQSSPHDIPLAGGGYYNVPVQDIGDYKVAYPATDIEYELRKMKVWCESNPAKLKTKKGIKRFINAWLAKADDLAKEKKPKPVNTDFSDWSR